MILCKIIAASDKQQGGHGRPAHKKSLQTQNGFRGLRYFYSGVTEQPTKAPFFLFGGFVQPMFMKRKSRQTVITHKFIGSASYASGSLITVICNSFALISVSCLHFGQ